MNSEIVVVVEPGEVQERSGTFKDDSGNDRAYTTRKQFARLEAGGFAYPYEVRLEQGQPPFKPGRYVMNTTKMLVVNKGVHSFSKYAVLEPAKA